MAVGLSQCGDLVCSFAGNMALSTIGSDSESIERLTLARMRQDSRENGRAVSPFDARFAEYFATRFPRVFRFLARLSGEPELAADLAQEAFIKLHERGSFPDKPDAWLITVAMNLFRNAKSTRARRRQLLTVWRAESVMADGQAVPGQSTDSDCRERVRAAMHRLTDRERRLLVLLAEGFRYRDIATALDLNEASVGTLLARAKRAFREAYAAEGRWHE
jgi:RNA polymerase sigma-70 factor (ECF subfamily)